MEKTKRFLLEMLTALVLFVFIVSFAVTFTLHFKPLYYLDVNYLQIEKSSGMSREEIKANYDTLIDYNSVLGGKSKLIFPTLAMSESGRIHFEEVKVIFVLFQWAAAGSFLLACVLLKINRRKGNYHFWKLACILTVAVPSALGILMALNWEWVFVTFHKLVFNNDYWIFDASTDPVIMILPDRFFFHCAAMILSGVIMGSFICLCMYKIRKIKNDST